MNNWIWRLTNPRSTPLRLQVEILGYVVEIPAQTTVQLVFKTKQTMDTVEFEVHDNTIVIYAWLDEVRIVEPGPIFFATGFLPADFGAAWGPATGLLVFLTAFAAFFAGFFSAPWG